MTAECSIDGCQSPTKARGWCGKHWTRWRTYGDPLTVKTGRGLTVEQRFWRFVDKTDSCWIWTGNLFQGYGLFSIRSGVPVRAHRFSYELTHGGIADGMELDHLCEVKRCVRPDHLEAVTHAENMRRSGVSITRRKSELRTALARIAELELELRLANERLERCEKLCHSDCLALSKAGSRNGRAG
jgi:hypothetical protein